jgi:tripartite ATP-independent transporter DctP family solute receptor
MNNAVKRIAAVLVSTGICLVAGAVNAQDIQQRTLKFTAASNKGHPQVQGVEKIAELVAAKSGGKIKVQVFPGGTLGPDLQVVSAMQGGTIDLNVMNASLLAGNVKEMTILDFPYLLNDAKEADALLDGPIGKKLMDKLPERGLIGLTYFDLGFREMHSKKPIAKAADLKGMKMRVIPTPIYIDFMNSTGANAVPMPFTETYGALEQNALDGMTNPLLNILDGKYNEVTKHLTLTNHMYTPQIVIVSKKTWDKLSPAEQKILRDAAVEATTFQRKVARDEATKVLDAAKKAGMTVHEFAAADIAKLREDAKPVIAKHAKLIGEDFVNEVNAELARMRGGAAKK